MGIPYLVIQSLSRAREETRRVKCGEVFNLSLGSERVTTAGASGAQLPSIKTLIALRLAQWG